MNRRMLPVLLLVAVSFFAPGRSSRATPPPEQGRTRLAVQVDMRNVLYHCTDRIVVHIPCAARSGPAGSLRFLAGALQGPSGGLYENHA
jgi:hypothetical protein